MFTLSTESLIAGGTVMLGGIIWLLRLESRVAVQETRFADLKELINVRFDRVEKALNGYMDDERSH